MSLLPAPGRMWPFRVVAVLMVALALGLGMQKPAEPGELSLPDPWAYAFAIENFSQGKLVIGDDEMAVGRMAARLQGGHLTQYVSLGANRWGLEKAPGYPLLVVPFAWMQRPWLANASLAMLSAFVLYGCLAAWLGEALACLGVGIWLFSPISLHALRQVYIDTYAGGALLVMAGSLALLYRLQAVRGRASLCLLFLAGGIAGWAGVVRFSNFLAAGLLGLFVVGMACKRRAPHGQRIWLPLGSYGLGLALALGALACYNLNVFGHLFDLGYLYSSYVTPVIFGWQVGRGSAPDLSRAGRPGGIAGVLQWLAGPLLSNWPFLPLALIGLIFAFRSRDALFPPWLAVAWIVVLSLPYGAVSLSIVRGVAEPSALVDGGFRLTRYFFPATFPVVLLAVYALARVRCLQAALTPGDKRRGEKTAPPQDGQPAQVPG